MKKNNIALLENEIESLISTKAGRRIFLQACPLLLASCATGPQSRYREGDNSGQEVSLSVAEEQRLTAEALPKMRSDYPAVPDRRLQNYISNLGQKVVSSNGLNANPYSYNFTLVDTPAVNAFALPAGTVFVTAPLMAMADSEAELIGVIGHEIGHIQARHTAERMHAQKNSQKKGLLYSIGGAAAGALHGVGVGKMACKKHDKECLARAAQYGALAGFGGTMLIQKYKFMANSREDEMEADRIGFKTSVQAGYDKNHVGKFYAKLLEMEQRAKGGGTILSGFADAMSTHPPSRERVSQMQQMAQEANSGGGKVSSKEFEMFQRQAKEISNRAQQRAKQG